MKVLPLFFVLLSPFLFAGCGSLGNPFSGLNLFGSGRDARVYNAQTGEYEWPKDQQGRSRARQASASTAPVPERKSDGRYFDVARNEWIDAPREYTPPSRPKPGSAPASEEVRSVAAMATPPPPPPAKASGVYNSSSGKIEWTSTSIERAPETPPRKGWRLWPF